MIERQRQGQRQGQRQERSMAVRQPYRSDLEDWVQRWDDFFNRPFLPTARQFFPSTAGEWSPSIDVMEKNDRYVIKAELPGVKEEDVEVSLTGDILTISGEKEEESEEEERGYHYSESSYGSFSRSLTVPSNVDVDDIDVNYDKGVLEIELPKTTETQPRKYKVSGGKKQAAGAKGKTAGAATKSRSSTRAQAKKQTSHQSKGQTGGQEPKND
jgi:HSP20 family protein